MDHALLHALNGFFFHHDAVEDPVLTYEKVAELLFVALLAGLFLFGRGVVRPTLRRAAVAAGASAGVALLIGQVIAHVVNRPRPFVADPGAIHLFASHAADAGFPSDHATAAFAIAVAILVRDRRWGLVTLAAAVILAIGRVGMGVHYPSDVLAGAALGTLVALVLWAAAPARRGLDVLADRVGGVVDRVPLRRSSTTSPP